MKYAHIQTDTKTDALREKICIESSSEDKHTKTQTGKQTNSVIDSFK